MSRSATITTVSEIRVPAAPTARLRGEMSLKSFLLGQADASALAARAGVGGGPSGRRDRRLDPRGEVVGPLSG
jgi:hypothetical protein